MKALRVDAGRLVLDPRAAPPVPGPGEAIVRPLRVALGEADAHAARAPASTPFTPGREFIGVVEQPGPGDDRAAKKRWEGKRVVVPPEAACGACDLCRAGLSAHCRARRVMGSPAWDGCLAERVRVPAASLVEVPPGIDDDAGALAWPLACAAHAARVVRLEGRPYVTVLGDGVSGLLTAQVAAAHNASVRVIGSRPAHLALCEKWGMKHRATGEAGLRRDQDVVFECTGSAAGLETALAMVRPRGKVVLTAWGAPVRERADLHGAVEGEIELVGARGGLLPEALALLARGAVDVLSLVSKRTRLDDAVNALKAASEPDALRVIVDI